MRNEPALPERSRVDEPKRTDNIVDRLLERISRREFYWETGAQFIRAGTFFQLFVHAQGCPDTFRAAKHFLMLPDLLNYWLTGRIANEYTIASMSQLMSLENREGISLSKSKRPAKASGRIDFGCSMNGKAGRARLPTR
ncbi:MAG: hypothetical protein JO151_16730, partial [Verrucomicrobia bacterium]|nr:hypothetical protein [Verrucomicrobiota bacterium]